MNEIVWQTVNETDLRQGDYLVDCRVPLIRAEHLLSEQSEAETPVETRDLIVMTQSCDLENKKTDVVVLCPVYTVKDFAEYDAKFRDRKLLENVRRGYIPGIAMLPSITDHTDRETAVIVTFRQPAILPLDYLMKHTEQLGNRPRLASPYTEYLSQAFANAFMRVGLRIQVPKF